MVYVVVRHQIEDYEKWKKKFDTGSEDRKTAGSKGGKIFRKTDDPNALIIALEWDTIENAQKMLQSDKLKQDMQEAGVIGQPEILFIEKIEDVIE